MADWNFEDFLRRLEAIKGIGSLDELVARVPGLGKMLREVDFRLEELDPIERILRAMTPQERVQPELLEGDAGLRRRERIAASSGSSLEAVDSLIAQFQELRTKLAEQSPEEVLQDAIEQQTGEELADWQTPAEAWKGDEHVAKIVDIIDEEDEPQAPAQVDWTAQVDQLLRKIAESGMLSLTAEERAFLDEASQRYRNRRG
jgi:hypothetical protein